MWSYRPALDGLRAFAVYVVVLYHCGLGVAANGFIGVDLFFVLSGFLVTSVVLDEYDKGTFRPIRFWARRFRRLLPAVAVVVVVTCVAFAAVTMPAERELALSDAQSVVFYFANWHFLAIGNDYFASEDLARPFTHYWSLAIEEQFYFAFPLIVIACGWIAKSFRRRFKSIFGCVIGLLAIASIMSQFWSANKSVMRAYYATDARVYQILLGSLLALVLQSPSLRTKITRTGSRTCPFLGILGFFALIVFASNLTSISVPLRGGVAAIASILLIGSLELSQSSRIARVFSSSLLVHLGRLSYATYLWHWPVIVIMSRLVNIGPISTSVSAVLVSTAFAELSLYAVETPIRKSTQLERRPWVTVTLGLALSLVVATVLVPRVLNSQAPSKLVKTTDSLDAGQSLQSIDFSLPPKLDWRGAKTDIPPLPDCTTTKPEDCIIVVGPPGGLRVNLVGDSHARTLIPALTKLAKAQGWTLSVTAVGGCPWQQGLRYADDVVRKQRCDEQQNAWYQTVIPALNPDVVILFNRAFDDPKFPRKMFIEGESPNSKSQSEIVRVTSEATIAALIKDGRIVVSIEPLPVAGTDETSCLSGAKNLRDCSFTASPGPLPTEVILRYLDLKYPEMVSLDIDPLVCPQIPLCLPVIDGIIVRRDAHHLTGTYSEHISSGLGDAIKASGILKKTRLK